jgi:hypothetical protein
MNKHPYKGTDGKIIPPGSKSTGWAFADAVIQRECPRCGAEAGFHCETTAGRRIWPPHSSRVVLTKVHALPPSTNVVTFVTPRPKRPAVPMRTLESLTPLRSAEYSGKSPREQWEEDKKNGYLDL